jgi:type II secretory pathway component PulF
MAIEQYQRPERVAQTGRLKAWFAGLQRSQRVSARDRRFFTEQLSLLLSTGTNLHASLQTLKEQLANPVMAQMTQQMLDDIAEGRQLSQALAKHPKLFSQTYINLIAASEDGGYMHEVLDQLVTMEEKRDQLQRTIIAAFAYPAFLLVFALGVVIFVLVVVFPKFTSMFAMIHDQLPVTTRWLMAVSDVFRHQWGYLLGGLVLTILAFRYWAASPAGRYRLDWAKLYLPGLRNFFIQLYLLQSLRVLSLSIGNGVNILDALHGCKEVVRNALFRRFIGSVEARVMEGEGIAVGFKNSSFIPPVVQQMISTGEETGNLAKVMTKLSDHYERELTSRLQLLSRMVEPVMLLVMGVVVGLLVSSLILPIFKLSRAVG